MIRSIRYADWPLSDKTLGLAGLSPITQETYNAFVFGTISTLLVATL